MMIIRIACAVALFFTIQTSSSQDNPELNQLVDISTPHVKAHGSNVENIKKGREVLERAARKLPSGDCIHKKFRSLTGSYVCTDWRENYES